MDHLRCCPRNNDLAPAAGLARWGRHRAGPPQAEKGVAHKANQQDGGQIRAKLHLFDVHAHCGTAQSAAHLLLDPCWYGHDDQRHISQNYPGTLCSGARFDHRSIADSNAMYAARDKKEMPTTLNARLSFRSQWRTSASTEILRSKNAPDVASRKLSIAKPISEMLAASALAKAFDATVKYSNLRPRTTTAVRSKKAVSAIYALYVLDKLAARFRMLNIMSSAVLLHHSFHQCRQCRAELSRNHVQW